MKTPNLRFRQNRAVLESLNKKERRKFPLVRCAIYILLSTLIVTGFSMSRYSATSPGGVDNARVAGFKVSVVAEAVDPNTTYGPQGSYNDVSIVKDNGQQSYKFTVKNESEVAVKAKLNIKHDQSKCAFSTEQAPCFSVTTNNNPDWKSGAWVYFN